MLAALSVRRGRPFLLASFALLLVTAYVYYNRAPPADLALGEGEPPPPPAAAAGAGAGAGDAPGQKPLVLPLSYGTTARPPLKGMGALLADLPPEFVPARPGGGRLVVVGDVHGQRAALQALLGEVGFSAARGDHLVLAGDLVSKGPDSAGVVALAMELGAHAVRGNHDDRVLLAHAAARAGVGLEAVKDTAERRTRRADGAGAGAGPGAGAPATAAPAPPPSDGPLDALEEDPFAHGDSADRATARSLTAAQLDWLARQPVILRVGPVPRDGGGGGGGGGGGAIADLVVVHGGLVPGLALDRQDPWAVMNMRTLAYPVDQARRAAARARLEEAARARGAKDPRPADGAVDAEAARLRALSVAASPTGTDDERDAVALPLEGREGRPWSEAWDAWQRARVPDAEAGRRVTVAYGHDARRGLRAADGSYALGLDSGCVYGRKLSALVVEAAEGGGARRRVVQVDCEKAASAS